MRKKADKISELIDKYTWIREVTDKAIASRSLSAEFHGIEQNIREIQKSLLDSYRQTAPIKHIRDKGDHREEILRHFLASHGLIPTRYAVSAVSTRAVSPSGHISPELDIVLYERDDAVVLKKYDKTLEYFPIESVHGAIQVKSKLSKTALIDALDNIRSFKSLKTLDNLESKIGGLNMAVGLYRRFGIIFAYEYDLDWQSVIEIIEEYSRAHGIALLPNLIVILDKGHFRIGDKERYCWHQHELETVTELVVHGFPDHEGRCLLDFYLILMEVLKKSVAGSPNLKSYIRMPLTSGRYSYSYSYGALTELGTCPEHGTFLKRITETSLEKILRHAGNEDPINWIRALDIARGENGDNEEIYRKQPTAVRIYNPDALPLSAILMNSEGYLTFESIVIDDVLIWVPWYYDDKDGLIETCPECEKKRKKTRDRSAIVTRGSMK